MKKFLLCIIFFGCAGVSQEDRALITGYEAEQLVCVDQAKTLDESRACRCKVKVKYGRMCP